MKNNQFRFIPQKKLLKSLANIFTMEKALFKIILWHKMYICQPIFNFFVALFKTFKMQNGDMVICFLESFRKVRFSKMQFLEDGEWTVDVMQPKP